MKGVKTPEVFVFPLNPNYTTMKWVSILFDTHCQVFLFSLTSLAARLISVIRLPDVPINYTVCAGRATFQVTA